MSKALFLFLALSLSVSAQTGLDKSNKLHAQLIGEWSIDLEETVEVFEKIMGKNKERFLAVLPSTLLKLSKLKLSISAEGVNINDGRKDYKQVFSGVSTKKNIVELLNVEDRSFINGFTLLEDGRLNIKTDNREQALFVWQKKVLQPDQLNKMIQKINEKYADSEIKVDVTRYVHRNQFEALEKLLKEKPEYANFGTKDINRSPLYEACRFKKTKFVRLLLENGANPNIQLSKQAFNEGGLAPLHVIGRSTSAEDWDEVKEICELLVKFKADVNQKAKYDETPLHSALSVSTTLPNEKLAIFLIESGADVNALNDSGETPIHQAFRHGVSEEFIKYMVEKKIKIPNAVSKQGMSAVSMAARSDRIDVLKLLIKHGFDLSTKNDLGGTLLQFGIDKKETLKFILDNVKGLDINADSKYYGTALRRAMARAKIDAVKLLLEYGAKIPQNYDPSQVASIPDNERMIYRLIKDGGVVRNLNEEKFYCTKEVHAVIKAHLEKPKQP